MNKRGFTIVELLAVIVILGAIMALTVTSISSSLKDTNLKAFEAKKNSIESAAVIYGQDNLNDLPVTVSVEDLVTNKYLNYDGKDKNKNDIVTDPRQEKESLNNCKIEITKNSAKKVIATFKESTC